MATGLILTGFAPNIFVTYVTYGLIAGRKVSRNYPPFPTPGGCEGCIFSREGAYANIIISP